MTVAPAAARVVLRQPADIIGAVPALIGFHPAESLVVVCLNGQRSRLGVTMRFDLPDGDDEVRWLDEVAARTAMMDCDQALVVAYDESSGAADRLSRVAVALELAAVAVRDALLVAAGRWRSVRCDDPSCCPVDGQPVPERPVAGPVAALAAEAALAGRVVWADRAALARSLAPVSGAQRRGLRRALTASAVTGTAEERLATIALYDGLARDWTASGETEVSVSAWARLVRGLDDLLARDAVIGLALGPHSDGLYALMHAVVRRALPPHAAAPCAVLAWLAYLRGDGALANVAVERALDCNPAYSLALLVADAADRQLPPDLLRAAMIDAEGAEEGASDGRDWPP